MRKTKVVIIGAGYIGASIGYSLLLKETVEEIVFIDANRNRAEGEVLDINHGITCMGKSYVRLGDYDECLTADMIIITAGKNRRDGQSRRDLSYENIRIMRNIVDKMTPYYQNAIVLVVSNPVDLLTYQITEWLGDKDGKIFGTGCMLDSSRLVRLLAEYTKASIDNIQISVIGEHGECFMPIWSKATIYGIGVDEYCSQVGIPWNDEVKKGLIDQVYNMGSEIIKRKERTHYGIAIVTSFLVDSVLNNHPAMVPVSSVLRGEYGINGVAMSVPTVISLKGAKRCLELKWTEEEKNFLKICAKRIEEEKLLFYKE